MGPRWVLVAASALLVAGCGEGKRRTVKDPSEENTSAPTQDETPRWEGASRVQEETPKSSGAAPVNEAPARRTDQYDKEATAIPLNRAARQVKENCGAAKDENGKATGPWGKVTIQIMLGHNGHSKEVTIPPNYAERPVGKCVEKAFTNLTFPPWNGPDTQIDQEIELLDPSKPAK